MKLHRIVAVNMASASTSAMRLDSQKAKEWVDPAIKVMPLILSILLSKLKTHVVRKRETYSKDRFRQRKSLNGLQCV